MKCENEQALLAALKGENPPAAWLLYGAEGYLIEKNTNRLVKRFTQGESPMELMPFDGQQGLDMGALSDAVLTLPLLAQGRCTLLQSLDPESLTADDLTGLGQLLEAIPPGSALICTAKTAPGKPAKGKGGKVEKLAALFDKAGCAARFERQTAADCIRLVRELAERRGCTLSREVAAALVERAGTHLLLLRSETEKLCAYAGGGAITLDHLKAVGSETVEAGVFDLSKAILSRDYTGALTLVNDLLYLREQPTTILAALSSSFVDLYRARAAKTAGVSAQQAVEELGYRGKDFLYRRAASQEGRYSGDFLHHALGVLARGDLALKSERTDGRVVLEKTITELFLLLQKEGNH